MSKIAKFTVLSHCNDLGGKLWNPAIRWTRKHAVFVVLEDDQGCRGVGECWCFDAAPDVLVAFLRTEVAPHVLGLSVQDIAACADQLIRRATLTARHGILASALSGVDIAAWDMSARHAGVPLWSCLNPSGPGHAPVYASGGLYGHNKGVPDLVSEMSGMSEMGFDLLKMKIGGLDMADDIARVMGVLAALPAATRLIVDGVYSYTPDQALRLFEVLPEGRIEAFQSPVPAQDMAGMRRLSRAGVPVMATEAEYRAELHRHLVETAEVAFLQTAPVACGGISRVRALADMVAVTPTRISLEVSSTAIALLAACQIAAADATIAHVEYHFLHQVFFDALPMAPNPATPGLFRLPAAPGLGMTLPTQDVVTQMEQSL